MSDDVAADLQTIDTWMIGDRMTTMAVSYDQDHYHQPGSLKLDLQVQSELESLIWQNLRQPVNPNIFMDEILAALILRNPAKNSVNCYFDQHSNFKKI